MTGKLEPTNSPYAMAKLTAIEIGDALKKEHGHKIINVMPTNLYGRHSLKSYGYRLGEYKGDFGETTDWASWTQEMQDYCIQDVKVTMKLCEHFRTYLTGAG